MNHKLKYSKIILSVLCVSPVFTFMIYWTKGYYNGIYVDRKPSVFVILSNKLTSIITKAREPESLTFKPANVTYLDKNGTILTYYNETYRNQYHYSPPTHWMNDPCGLVYHKGEYHLFYQYNPVGMTQNFLSWGHAVSPDLFHWETLGIALMHKMPVEQLFSGSAVVDHGNTTGFGPEALVVMYTNFYRANEIQNQHLAYSLDRGRTFTDYRNNPVLGTNLKHIRDPKIFWYPPLNEWRLVIVYAFSFKMLVFGSKNLIDWEYYSMFEGTGKNLWVWETPDLFELLIEDEGGIAKWVLVMAIKNHEKDHENWATSRSSQGYYIGHFDGYNFVPDYPEGEVQFLDYGHDYFAGQSFENVPNGRRIMLGWLNSWLYANTLPTKPWRGEQTIPRELRLVRNQCNNGRLELWQDPVPEVKGLRTENVHYDNVPLSNLADEMERIRGKQLEIEIVVKIKQISDWFNLLLHSNSNYTKYTLVGYNHRNSKLFTDVNKSGFMPHEQFHRIKREADLKPCNGRIQLRIFMDSTSVEVFANYGSFTITTKIFPDREWDHIAIQGVPHLHIEYFSVYKLRSVWH